MPVILDDTHYGSGSSYSSWYSRPCGSSYGRVSMRCCIQQGTFHGGTFKPEFSGPPTADFADTTATRSAETGGAGVDPEISRKFGLSPWLPYRVVVRPSFRFCCKVRSVSPHRRPVHRVAQRGSGGHRRVHHSLLGCKANVPARRARIQGRASRRDYAHGVFFPQSGALASGRDDHSVLRGMGGIAAKFSTSQFGQSRWTGSGIRQLDSSLSRSASFCSDSAFRSTRDMRCRGGVSA